jgi:hypothetical protein
MDASVDELLEDDALVDAVYEAQGERHEQSRTLGRPQAPAEVVLRMLILSTSATGVTKYWSPNEEARGRLQRIFAHRAG